MIREISLKAVEDKVKELCIEANFSLRTDVFDALDKACSLEEEATPSKEILSILLENAKVAKNENIPICQDTGAVTVFLEIGADVHITGGNVTRAVNIGVEKAYGEANLRKSIVSDPVLRDNTGTNTPAFVHTEIVEGDKLTIYVMPKGFGSENKSKTIMLNPTSTVEEIIAFCVNVVRVAGPDGCPPYVLGIGIGGTLDACTLQAKKALLRPIGEDSSQGHIADMEKKILEEVNALDIGVMGLGGKTTVLGVNINEIPTHIAGLPVAVNVCCHALRSASGVI